MSKSKADLTKHTILTLALTGEAEEVLEDINKFVDDSTQDARKKDKIKTEMIKRAIPYMLIGDHPEGVKEMIRQLGQTNNHIPASMFPSVSTIQMQLSTIQIQPRQINSCLTTEPPQNIFAIEIQKNRFYNPQYGIGTRKYIQGRDEKIRKIQCKVDNLSKYACTLKLNRNKSKNEVTLLAALINRFTYIYCVGNLDKETFGRLTIGLIEKNKNILGNDRKFKDILGHILLALTGIGLIVMAGKKIATGSFFLNQTKRQKLLGDIEKEVKTQCPKPPSPK